MDYTKEDTVICLDGDCLKTCALYFDKIMPLSINTLLWPIDEILEAEFNAYINKNIATYGVDNESLIFYEIFKEEHAIIKEVSRIEHEFFEYRTGDKNVPPSGPKEDYIRNTQHPKYGYFRDCINKIFLKYGLIGKYPIVAPENSIFANTEHSDDLLLSLVGLQLINTENISWEQIFELRKDLDALSKLRRLRLFLYKNYSNQSPAYIEDDINERIDSYLNTCKKYDFNTKASTFDILLNSKSTIALGLGAMMAIVAGSPIVATSAILSGASIEIGKLSLNLAKKKHAFINFENDHDLAYIFKVRKILGDQKSI